MHVNLRILKTEVTNTSSMLMAPSTFYNSTVKTPASPVCVFPALPCNPYENFLDSPMLETCIKAPIHWRGRGNYSDAVAMISRHGVDCLHGNRAGRRSIIAETALIF